MMISLFHWKNVVELFQKIDSKLALAGLGQTVWHSYKEHTVKK